MNMKKETWGRFLQTHPCDEAKEFVQKHKRKSAQKIWELCENGSWMLWLEGKSNGDRKQLVLASCACARLSLEYVKEGELRPLKAIETAEQWARGENNVSLQDV